VKRLIACVAVALFGVACNSDGGGGNPADPSQVNVEFSFSDLTVGTGAEAVTGKRVALNFELWLYNPSGTASKGTRIQGSTDPCSQCPGGIVGPVDFTIGASNIIAGFEQGVRGMRVGGRRRLYIPPSLAYGAQGAQGIPSNASIVFEVELTSVQ